MSDARTPGSAFSVRPERSEPGDAGAERAALKARLLRSDETGSRDYFALQAKCVRRFGPSAGIFIRQLVFWTDKSMLADGWLYKTRNEMQEETGLSRRQQEKARKILTKKGVLEEDIRTVPPHHHYRVLHYRVRLAQLLEMLTEAEDGDSEPDLRDAGTGPGLRDADSAPEVWDRNGEPGERNGSSTPLQREPQERTAE